MKHILHLVCIALPLVCGADIATAFARGCRPPMAPVASFMVRQKRAATLWYRHRNPNEGRRNRNKSRQRWPGRDCSCLGHFNPGRMKVTFQRSGYSMNGAFARIPKKLAPNHET